MGSAHSIAAAAAGHFRRLMAAPSAIDPDDWRALAAAIALAAAESEAGEGALLARLGLSPNGFELLRRRCFPGATDPGLALPEAGSLESVPEADAERRTLVTLLLMHRGRGRPEEAWFAEIIARRSLEPRHLWQDMGLASREELNALIRRHFPRLHARNRANMKWKKFFYRQICADRSFALCLAPSCAECGDFAACFGSEEGEALIPDEGSAGVAAG